MNFNNLNKLILGLGLLCLPAIGSAISLTFDCISHNNPQSCLSGETQLGVSLEGTGDTVTFTFSNVGDASSVIAQIYFDDSTGVFESLSSISVGSFGKVKFTEGAKPGNLPAGKPIGFSADYSLGAVSPSPKNGINNGTLDYETLSVSFNLTGDYAALLTALTNGELRIGIHAQAFKGGYSESFVNQPLTAVPVPAAVWLFGSGLLGITLVGRRRSHLMA